MVGGRIKTERKSEGEKVKFADDSLIKIALRNGVASFQKKVL